VSATGVNTYVPELALAYLRRKDRWRFLLGAILFLTLAHGQATAVESGKSKIAIVVANSNYSELGSLRNPAADGQLVASSLRAAGFNVTYLQNLRDEQFRTNLREIAKASARADVTLFYYAGHAAQIGGVNYLLPIDVPSPEQEDDIRLASISADDVLSVIKSPYKVLVLDACRDNPVLGRALSHGRGASYKHGLAAIAPPAEPTGGIFIAYSTQTDAVAIDGDGANSPFAESFAKYADTPASIDDMFAMVTRDVLKKTNGFQRPFKYASLDTVFCLANDCPSRIQPQVASSAAVAQSALAFANSAQDAFASLAAAKSAGARKSIEDKLWQELRRTLPKRVVYGSTPPDAAGKTLVYAFLPETVVGDSHRATVTIQAGEIKDGHVIFDESGGMEESIDCDTNRAARIRTEYNGQVKIFTQAEQRVEMQTVIASTSIAASLIRALCVSPLRITPLWAVDALKWVPVGVGSAGLVFAAAPQVAYRDPTDAAIRYVLVRATGVVDKKDDVLGAELRYGWTQINCGTKQFAAAGAYLLAKNGTILAVLGNLESPQAFADNSPAANDYVLMCDVN
jgi:uncharacterized caspase-like protein